MASTALKQDAGNRALRTFLQGLAIDVSVAVAMVLYEITSAGEPDWRIVPALLAKTVIHSAAAFVMRLRTGLLLPGTPQPEPATPDPAP